MEKQKENKTEECKKKLGAILNHMVAFDTNFKGPNAVKNIILEKVYGYQLSGLYRECAPYLEDQ